MITQIEFSLTLTEPEHVSVNSLLPWRGDYLDHPPNEEIAIIKNRIREQLTATQTKCSYCGLKLYGTSKGEIEHIAPKATSFRHPEFTFTLQNLTFACHWCNTSEKKGTKDTIKVKNAVYTDCEFNLVHPYLDDPEEHYEWTDNRLELLIQIRNNSAKAKFSIEMFKLDTLEMNEHRAKQIRYEELKAEMKLNNADQQLLESAVDFHGNE